MLDCMADGIFSILFDGLEVSPLYSLGFEPQREIKGNLQEWVLIYKGE